LLQEDMFELQARKRASCKAVEQMFQVAVPFAILVKGAKKGSAQERSDQLL
jgi:hypothetical protein